MLRLDLLNKAYEQWAQYLSNAANDRYPNLLIFAASTVSDILTYTNSIFGKSSRKDDKEIIHSALRDIKSSYAVPSMVRSIDSAILILEIARQADQQLLRNTDVDQFFNMLTDVARGNNRISKQGFQGLKVLCIEGLPGSGKSTLVEGLVLRAGAIVIGPLVSPSVATIRNIFSESPEPVQTALSFALNYCTAHRIITEVAAAPDAARGHGDRLVVVDEFYHSVCARTVCTNVNSGVDLKSLPASAFEWPLDLPTPSLVSNDSTPIICSLHCFFTAYLTFCFVNLHQFPSDNTVHSKVMFLSLSLTERAKRLNPSAWQMDTSTSTSTSTTSSRPVASRFTTPLLHQSQSMSKTRRPFWSSCTLQPNEVG